jgi:hypothetical protein
VARKWVGLRHVIEGGVDLLRRYLPGHERAVGQVRGQKGLAHAADCAGFQHRGDARHYGLHRHAGAACDFLEWLAHKALDLVLGDGEDFRVDRVVVFYR